MASKHPPPPNRPAPPVPISSSTSVTPPAPSLQESITLSTESWQQDLRILFLNAKDWFPDVVWEVGEVEGELEEIWGHKAIVYARAPPSFQTRYFQFRPSNAYGSNGALSPSPNHSPSHTPTPTLPGNSALSLNLGSSGLDMDMQLSRSPSPLRSASRGSPMSTPAGPITRLHTSITPALFSNELEYLYTGQGFGEAFEFLFDDSGGELGLSLTDAMESEGAQELRVDKLRKDLVFMWRSRLYSDVKISLEISAKGGDSANMAWAGWTGTTSKEHENITAVFSTHRFILVSRSSYFRTLLLGGPSTLKLSSSASSAPGSISLPSPPFTPASLHFTLGYLYTGTLAFSHRTYDLTTALHIYLSSLHMYLNLPKLRDEVRGRIIMELCHGLFHAFLEFGEYESLVRGIRGGVRTSVASKRMSASGIGTIGGCRCRSCARRAPRILQFASYLDNLNRNVKDDYLERGARRALVGLLGDGWVTSEWASMEGRLREAILRGVQKRIQAEVGKERDKEGRGSGGGNIWNMLFAVESALAPQGRLAKAATSAAVKVRDKAAVMEDDRRSSNSGDKNWHQIVRADLLRAREMIDDTLAERAMDCFTPPPHPSSEEDVTYSEWHEILMRAAPSYQQQVQKQVPTRHNRLASIVSSLSPSTLTPSNASDVSVHVSGRMNTGPASAYEDGQNVDLILASVLRGVKSSNAPLVYQTLVNVLLLPAVPQDPDLSHTSGHYPSIYEMDKDYIGSNALLLPPTSHVRIQVENARMEVLRWISGPGEGGRGKWREVRDQGGFANEAMEGWALTEIADHLQIPLDEVLQPPPNPRSATSRVTSTTPTPSRDRLRPRNDSDRDTVSIHSTNSVSPSMRVSILSKNLPLKSSASSIRSVNTVGTAGRRKAATPTSAGERPDSKLTPDSSVVLEEDEEDEMDIDEVKSTPTPTSSTLVSTPPRSASRGSLPRVVSPSPSTSSKKVKKPVLPTSSPSPSTKRLASSSSLASSRSSLKSVSSTTRSISPRAAISTSPARPRSSASAHSTLSTKSTVSTASKVSTVSKASTTTTSTVRRHARGAGAALQVPPVPLPRSISASTSGGSNVSGSSATSDFHTAPSSGGTPRQRERSISAISTGSAKSARSTKSTKSLTPSTRNTTGTTTKRPPSVTSVASTKSARVSPADKARAQAQAVTSSRASPKTNKSPTISKKASSDTIKGTSDSSKAESSKASTSKKDGLVPPVPSLPSSSTSGASSPSLEAPSPPTETEPEIEHEPYPTHLGATLSIGIPCIVSSRRKRFRAFARYIGEVEGESGPWVGVEVPVHDSEKDRDRDVVMGDSRPWNDGSWRGIRYFDLGTSKTQNGSGEAEEWGDSSYGDSERSTIRRRKGEREMPSAFTKGTKRRVDQWSGDSQSTSRYNTVSSKRMRMGLGMGRSASPSMSDGGYGSGATESRGLFVRPQQVLYVVDAIDADDL